MLVQELCLRRHAHLDDAADIFGDLELNQRLVVSDESTHGVFVRACTRLYKLHLVANPGLHSLDGCTPSKVPSMMFNRMNMEAI